MPSRTPGALRLVAVATFIAWAARALIANAQPPASARNSSDATPIVARSPRRAPDHRDLQRAITDFQDKWRKAWEKVERKRHDPIDLNEIRGWSVQRDGSITDPIVQGDRDAQNMTPDLRRYLAMLCYIGTPSDRTIEEVKSKAKNNLGGPTTKAGIALAQSQAGMDGVDRMVANNGGGTFALSLAMQRMIRPKPDYGAVCPSWNPPDLPLQLDEGEAIDLALPPSDRAGVRKDREALIRKLEVAHAQFPDDDWIAGQRVRFVYDQRSPSRTVEAARACNGNRAWCAGLLALAMEQAGEIRAAQEGYQSVDSLMLPASPDTAGLCIESEVLLLLNTNDRDTIRRAPCERQRTLVQQLWWLADPLWSVAGNERYVAHESRRLSATLRAINDRDERYIWARLGGGEAMRELLVRYGWPGYTYWPGIKFEDEINLYLENATTRNVYMPHTAVEYSSDRTALIPAMAAIVDPFSLTLSHWNLNLPPGTSPDAWWPQEHMMLFTKLTPLPNGQDIKWRRDSAVFYQIAVDDPLRNLDTAGTGPSLAALMGGASAITTRALANSAVGIGNTLRLGGYIKSTPIVLSAEILPRTLKERAMRLRFGLHPPPTLREMLVNEVALSDPLFLRMPNRELAVPTDQPSVLRYMAGGLTFTRIEPLAVYWESYGFAPGDSVQVTLKVRRNDEVNVARRLASSIGIASALRDSITVQWTEPDARHASVVLTGSKPVVGRSVALDLTALPPGRYVLTVEMRRGANTSATSERQFVIGES